MCQLDLNICSDQKSKQKNSFDRISTVHAVLIYFKVSGLRLFQCKLCAFVDESCARVRAHYLREHPRDLPLLCGHCRERCDETTYRRHHEKEHSDSPLKVCVNLSTPFTQSYNPCSRYRHIITLKITFDESCARVRAHYLREHPRDLPLLCGHCRERCDETTFRRHHEKEHSESPLKVGNCDGYSSILLVYELI